MLVKYRYVFTDCPGKIKGFEYEFKLKKDETFVKKLYPVPLKYRERMRWVINKMLNQNIIEQSNSPYINPLAITLKKDGTIRTRLDARELNELIESDHAGPETMEEILAQCDGVKYISCLNLNMSFWQVSLAKWCRKYTAFKIFGVVYQFKMVPFGTKVSGAALQRASQHAFGYLDFVLRYVDENTCISKDFRSHLKHLEIIFKKCQEYGITLNFKKCNFCVEQIEFLGYILSTEGLKINPDKTKKIREFPIPTSKKQMQSFLGLINWCSKFNRDN